MFSSVIVIFVGDRSVYAIRNFLLKESVTDQFSISLITVVQGLSWVENMRDIGPSWRVCVCVAFWHLCCMTLRAIGSEFRSGQTLAGYRCMAGG
jgi:hypothetical protein